MIYDPSDVGKPNASFVILSFCHVNRGDSSVPDKKGQILNPIRVLCSEQSCGEK